MDKNQASWNAKVAQGIIENLEKRRIAGSYAETGAQATALLLEKLGRAGEANGIDIRGMEDARREHR